MIKNRKWNVGDRDTDREAAEKIAAALGKSIVMDVFMKNCAVRRAEVLLPLVFDVDQRPLAAAELEMLKAGKQEEVLLLVNHPMRVHVTPSGRCASSTFTI